VAVHFVIEIQGLSPYEACRTTDSRKSDLYIVCATHESKYV